MKKILSLFALLTITVCSFSQGISINENGIPPDNSAMLDISSHTKGVLVPRLRTTEREAIIGPAEGLLVYDIDTHSFWFSNFGIWKEIMKSGAPANPTGPAGGDLSGDYPAPTVAKIQNLDVNADVPTDKQVMKWDTTNNQWKGQNDSLFLPYVAASSASHSLLSVTNNYNGFAYTTALLGRRLGGSGIGQIYNSGVWGDADAAPGIVGTSNILPGVLGKSISYHGVQGSTSGGDGFAGIYGTTDTDDGIGVMGSINIDGTGIFGNVLGTLGTAGVFQSPAANHNDITLLTTTSGEGILSSFKTFNQNNTNPAIEITHEGNGNGVRIDLTNTIADASALEIQHEGNGHGLKIDLTNSIAEASALDILHEGNGHGLKIDLSNSGADANALDIHHAGAGTGIYSQSESGTSGKFENTNNLNTSPVALINTNSLGSSLQINATHTGLGSPAVDINLSGVGTGIDVNTVSGNPATFTISGPESTKTNLIIQQNGTGKGIYLNQNNSVTNNAAFDLVSQGKKGIVSQVNGDNAVSIYGGTGAGAMNPVGVKGLTYPDATNGIGVLGVAGANDGNGIGVKGIAGGGISGGIGVLGETSASTPQAIAVKGIGYTHNEDVGAITGINMTDGVGVFGEALGMGGIGVAGTVGNTNNNSIAAKFRNNYNNSTAAVMELISNGKGTSLFSDNTNLNSSATMVRVRNAGTGKFLTFENNLGSIITSVDKGGNMVTDGTITVQENMGIVRNSSATQLRTEIINAYIPSGDISHYDQFNAYEYVYIDFGTEFSSPPAVFLGNIQSGNMGGLRLDIEDVTTTGFTIVIKNYTPYDFSYSASVFKVMAIGPE